jgi:multidrug efflux pump subunit AcrA (membrane-fusion protein)
MQSKAKQLYLITMLSLLMVLATGCVLLPMQEPSLKPPLVEPARETLDLYEVKREDIQQEVKGVATLEPIEVEYYQFKESGGRVHKVHAAPGDRVEAGDLLLELDMDGDDIELKQRQLEVAKKKRALLAAKQSRNLEDMEIALLELDIAQLLLERTKTVVDGKRLVSTTGGQITFITAKKPGDLVQAYEVLASVADISKLQLYLNVTAARDMDSLTPGMAVEVTYKGESYSGSVVQTPSSAVQEDQQKNSQHLNRVYIAVEGLPENARIGEFADVRISIQERKDTLVIPNQGLRSYQGRRYVQIMDGISRKEVDVEIGIETATSVEIVQGLVEGQKIVLK